VRIISYCLTALDAPDDTRYDDLPRISSASVRESPEVRSVYFSLFNGGFISFTLKFREGCLLVCFGFLLLFSGFLSLLYLPFAFIRFWPWAGEWAAQAAS